MAADPLPAPGGPPILTITGHIRSRNTGRAAVFDRAMIEALGMQAIVTITPWDDGPIRFEGVAMVRLLRRVGAVGKTVEVTGLDDYCTEIPTDDFTRFDVILALKRNGRYMSVQERGPLFLVYSFDSSPELRSREYYSRAVWQVAKITVE